MIELKHGVSNVGKFPVRKWSLNRRSGTLNFPLESSESFVVCSQCGKVIPHYGECLECTEKINQKSCWWVYSVLGVILLYVITILIWIFFLIFKRRIP